MNTLSENPKCLKVIITNYTCSWFTNKREKKLHPPLFLNGNCLRAKLILLHFQIL